MKPIEVEFVSVRPALRWIWALAASVGLGALAATVAIVARQDERLGPIRSETRALREQHARDAARLQVASPSEAAEPASQRAALRAAAQHLQADFNPILAVIERVHVPGTQLVQMGFERGEANAAGNAIRLEYQLDSMQQLGAVSAALNAGDRSDWRVESVGAGNGGVRAVWRYVGQ